MNPIDLYMELVKRGSSVTVSGAEYVNLPFFYQIAEQAIISHAHFTIRDLPADFAKTDAKDWLIRIADIGGNNVTFEFV